MPALPAATEALLFEMDALPPATELTLAGGSALALRIGHRLSEDLDFVFPGPELPRRLIANLLDALRIRHGVKPMPNPAAEADFTNAGLDIADFQQDYSIDGVKLTVFVPDPGKLANDIQSDTGLYDLKGIRIATLDSLFLMKALTLNSRVMSRDLYDLYILVEQHHYPPDRIFTYAEQYGFSSDVLKQRLISARKRRDDPGFRPSASEAPSFEQLKAYFEAMIDRLETQAAEKAFREKPHSDM